MRNRLIALGLCAVVLAGLAAYFMLNKQEEAEEEPDYYMIIDRPESDIAEFTISSGKETLTFVPDSDSEIGWSLRAEPRLKLDPYYMRSLLRGVTELGTETKVIENNLAAFGLEPPQTRADILYSDGEKNALLIGRTTPDGEYYYLMREGDPAVYLVNIYAGEKYSFTLEDLTDMGVQDISGSELQYAYINDNGSEIEVLPAAGEHAGLELTRPYNGRGVYLNDFNDLVLSGLYDLRFDELVALDGSDADYGLDRPSLRVTARDNENEVDIIVGGDAGDGRFYARRAGDGMIFAVDGAKLAKFRDIDVFAFIDRFVYLIGIDSLSGLTVQDGGTVSEVDLNPVTVKNTDGVEETTYSPTVNGKEADMDALRVWYQSLAGLSFDSALDGFTPTGEPVLTVAYHKLSGETEEFKYYDYNNNFCAVNDGGSWFAVNNQSLNTARRLLAGLVE